MTSPTDREGRRDLSIGPPFDVRVWVTISFMALATACSCGDRSAADADGADGTLGPVTTSGSGSEGAEGESCVHVHFREVDVQWSLDAAAQDLVAADLDGDGFPELVVTQDGRPMVILRNRRGERGADGNAFDQPVPIGDRNAWAVVVTDWNGDGRPDLIANSGRIIVLENKGNLTFDNVNDEVLVQHNSTQNVRVADMNGDGREDIVVYGGRGMSVYPAPEADGSLGEPFLLELGPVGLRRGDLGDLDGDGIPDLAIASFTGDPLLVVAHGDGRGGFERIEHHQAAEDMQGLEAMIVDVDADGVLDVLVIGHTRTAFGTDDYVNRKPRLALMRGVGGGALAEAAVLELSPGGVGWTLAQADLEGEGRPAIVALARGINAPEGDDIPGAYHLLSYGDDSLQILAPGFIDAGATWPRILLDDLDADGRYDLVRASGSVAVHWGCSEVDRGLGP